MPLWNRFKKVCKNFCGTDIPMEERHEFTIGVAKSNVNRVKSTSITFIVIEILLIIAYTFSNHSQLWRDNQMYILMYFVMLLAMVTFLFLFLYFEQDIQKYLKPTLITGSFFAVFTLLWCVGISLLDQSNNGQVIVYVFALLAIAVVPIFQPMLLLLIYSVVHVVFLVLLPSYQSSVDLTFANAINTSAFLIVAWTISCARYKKQEEDFKNQKLLQESSRELKRINYELEEVNAKLEILSQTDGLTGIFNRMMFETKIVVEWNRCKHHNIPLSMLMMDIDFFKPYNDHYGHRAGDRCIQQIAEVLKCYTKHSSHFVARYGGEEFAMVMPHSNETEARTLAEIVRQAVEDLAIPHQYSEVAKVLTISIGVYSMIPNDQTDLEHFIELADQALYRAKLTRNVVAN